MGYAKIEALIAAREFLENQFLVNSNVNKPLLFEKSLKSYINFRSTFLHSMVIGKDSLGFNNIVGAGISEKRVKGKYTGEPCVTVYVEKKADSEQVATEALIPKNVNSVPTDVIASGKLYAQGLTGYYRPAPCGVSVGHHLTTAGTLGCVVKGNSRLFILSNNHVLANCNNTSVGDHILQPAKADGGRIQDHTIATLSSFVPINFRAYNYLDCAIAEVLSDNIVSNVVEYYGQIGKAITECSMNFLVKKCGRTTEFTHGRVTGCNATMRIDLNGIDVIFKDQIMVESTTSAPFSQPGDSGSLIVTETGNNPVGLLFAGSQTLTSANPISAVLSALDVTIVT
ncbi:hypothetical protein [Candidatus Magnetobacterium casense]|uniref:hypothetical protein n=1 Tax=Candidatus Magnetobacterium casense TaxID=1455061 RepID=UPI000698771A|nr:hypothetical protein [Candidatus Magnetobacterium casensis]